MISVSSELRDFYISENPNRQLIVTIGSGESAFTLTQKQIIAESMELKEAISESDTLEFVGCISSQFRLHVVGVKQKLKNKDIHVEISCNHGRVTLFNGTINSDERTANRRVKEIIAYDALYGLSGVDATQFVNELTYPITVKNFRGRFFDFIGIYQKTQTLKIDNIQIVKPVSTPVDNTPYLPENKTLTALDVIKSICQAEGVFGIINREGEFEYRQLAKYTTDDGAYPGTELITPFVPGVASETIVEDAQFYPSYRSLSLETYNVNNIHTVTVKQNDDSQTKGYYSLGGNKYTVLGNLFTMYQELPNLERFAGAIADNIADVDFTPFDAECIGLPFIECGDAVDFYVYDFEASEKQKKDVYVIQTFFILSRTFTGIMSTKDVFNATAEKKKKRVSDLGIRVSLDAKTEQLEKEVKEVKEQSSGYDGRISELENNSLKCKSVASLPTQTEPNTIYLIQGTVG